MQVFLQSESLHAVTINQETTARDLKTAVFEVNCNDKTKTFSAIFLLCLDKFPVYSL